MDTVKDKAGCTVGDKTNDGCAGGTDMGFTSIRERMDVIASCGKKVGVVDHVEGNTLKLTRKDSPDGQHHFIPADWVDHVDGHVHLKKNSEDTEKNWKADAASCCGS
ncbi:MAG: DUF2171 domain-containing protein [Planctomycetes bacterium]|nr:DUF2171 domain-containing protein [Planctomycetota bacterium]